MSGIVLACLLVTVSMTLTTAAVAASSMLLHAASITVGIAAFLLALLNYRAAAEKAEEGCR